MSSPPRAVIVAADPVGVPNPRLVTAAGRAGHIGLLDVVDEPGARADLDAIDHASTAPLWVRVRADLAPSVELTAAFRSRLARVVVRAEPGKPLDVTSLGRWSDADRGVVAQVTSADEAARRSPRARPAWSPRAPRPVASSVDRGVRALPAAGRRWASRCGCGAGSACTRRPGWSPAVPRAWSSMRSSPLSPSRRSTGRHVRRSRPWTAARPASWAATASSRAPICPLARLDAERPRRRVSSAIGPRLFDDLLPIGQDGAFAAPLARRFGTVGGIVQGFAAAIDAHAAAAADDLAARTRQRGRRRSRHAPPDRAGPDDPRQRPRRVRRGGRRRRAVCRSSRSR